jgi:AAA domain (dynein-related subfamily)
MSAIDAALSTIDRVAQEGDLAPERPIDVLELGSLAEPIVLPDGKRIYPPRLHGQPIDELACALIDTDRPAESTFLRLTGPPGAGKSQIARAIAYRLWRNRGRDVEDRYRMPFYGFVEISGGPSSDEYLFRHEFVPAADDAGTVRLVDSAFVQAMREGWVVMIDEVNTIGHLMSAVQSRGRPTVFVQQLHRAAAQRGKLDPFYQELSDHWTAILQRLYPVWALIGPGLSDPGHIEIHSARVREP